MANSSKTAVFIGDLHTGSRYAVKSPDATLSNDDGDAVYSPQNPLQKKLFEAWQWSIDELENKKPDVLVCNGEPFDGSNYRSAGMSNWTTDMTDQMDDAERLLKLYQCKNFLMTRGTRYHVEREQTSFEEELARKLGAVPYRGYTSEKVAEVNRDKSKPEGMQSARTDYYLWFKMNGKLFSVTHHVGFNKWFAYRTTAIAREMAAMEFERGRWYSEEDKISVFVRSHVHYYVLVGFSKSYGFTTPAWKMPDPFLLKGGLGGTMPTIGNVEVIVEGDGKITIRPHVLSSKFYPKPKVLEF